MTRMERIKKEHVKEYVFYYLQIITLVVVILSMMCGAMWIINRSNNDYNKNMCQMYGYLEDCKTPLTQVK